MFVDSRTLPSQHIINADLCIIGAGAVGITLASKLNKTGLKVAIFESGGFDMDGDTQALYEGDGGEGENYIPVAGNRLRYFGGSTNHWGGLSHPLDRIDFEKRDWVPYSGWPISYEEFIQYLPEAHKFLDLGSHDYNYQHWFEDKKVAFDLGRNFTTEMWRLVESPTDFAQKKKKAIEDSSNVTVYLYSNLIKIESSENHSSVKRMAFSTITGGKHYAIAKKYVLACGGIENSRLLLLARLGGKDVGRFFIGHSRFLHHSCKWSLISDTPLHPFYTQAHRPGGSLRALMKITDDTQRNLKLLNCGFRIDREIENKNPLAKEVLDLSSKLLSPKQHKGNYLLVFKTEQAPNPESRIMLSDQKDIFGLPKVKVRWQRNELDASNIESASKLFAQAIGESGLGRVQLTSEALNAAQTSYDAATDFNHHIGGTRMSESAQTGVVDIDSKVFGVDNLYVLGSSVFPTCGWVNPTLNIVMLTLRFIRHILPGH